VKMRTVRKAKALFASLRPKLRLWARRRGLVPWFDVPVNNPHPWAVMPVGGKEAKK